MSTKSRSLLSIEATATTLEKLINRLSNHQKYTLLTSLDVCLFLISMSTAIGCQYGFAAITSRLGDATLLTICAIAIKIGTFWTFGIYQQVLRYIGVDFIFTIAKAIAVSTLASLVIANYLITPEIPTAAIVWDGILSFIAVVACRWGIHLTMNEIREIRYGGKEAGGVAIYGAGSAGCILAQAIAGDNGKRSICFVDDNIYLQGRNVQGIRVYAPSDLPRLKSTIGFTEILLAMPSIDGDRKRLILQQLQELEVPVKTVPSITEILKGRVAIDKVRDLDIEDLLGRKAIAARPELLQHDITDRVVLVTGGGGSIGSELCRQIAKLHPKRLIVFELNEFALYQMDMELGETYPELTKSARLGSVTDARALTNVFKEFGVETVYHAAAYKHVPIVEANPLSGAVNNIGGTLIAAQCALASGVKKFVLISTDKAVRPTNIMGATKRVAELILQGLADRTDHRTCFTMVRFGNVLGSSGSVVPRFREQIAAGKSLTVTHPDITRYFMTIPEAATLVIQAGAMAKGGEVFLLDMGEPVKIYDLATQIIRLHGMEPHKDIEIEITGLRPGEKIYEELLIDCEGALSTLHPKIFCAREAKLSWDELSPQLDCLLTAAAVYDVAESVAVLRDLVPEYQPMGKYAQTREAVVV